MQLDEPNNRTTLQMVCDQQESVHTRIEAALARAENAAEAYIAKLRFEREQAHRKWTLESNERYKDNGLLSLLGRNAGRSDDTYTAELPLDIGWNSYDDGTSLAYVAIGGVDIAAYLPPDVLKDIQNHINSKWEDEQ